MGLIDRFLPERLPRQWLFAGDRHAEVVTVSQGRISGRRRLEGVALADGGERDWDGALAGLQPEESGLIFGASPFIFNFFEFDRLPWQRKALRELVAWRLQKIFPGDLSAYDHRFYRLDRRRILSVLAPRALLAGAEARFRQARAPLTFIGSSTLTLLARMQQARPAPDFLIESDGAGVTMLFQQRRLPLYIRKFRGSSAADAIAEAGKTAAFVRGQYGADPRRYWLIDHGGDAAAIEAGLASVAGSEFVRLPAGPDAAPPIPGCP
jgi:hypothetical protein